MTARSCEIPACEKPPRSGKQPLCETHYYRMRRTGTTDPRPVAVKAKPAPVERRKRALCIFSGCDVIDDGPTGYCKMHQTRIRRHGSPNVKLATGHGLTGEEHPQWRGEEVTYSGAHMRVRAVRGSARRHTCACGMQAKHWSYDHRDPAEKSSDMGPYSPNPDRYVAKCVPCHKRSDMALLREARK
jgi:hypothetical protein